MVTDPSTSADAAPVPVVVAVVTADDATLLKGCLEAIGRQVYGPARVFVVGGDEEVRRVAADSDASWRPSIRGIYDTMGPDVAFIWALRQRARPEPGALQALIEDGSRVDASVAGSKIVDAENPEVLVSVGYATDVFDAPYSGLQKNELDQEQYDVIRDVASVGGTSVLIRRDLFRGLGGLDPLMTQTSAAVDFCQRARLRGGRVVVVPSSVVRYQGPDPAPRWRERAGETRAMIKAYGPLTLLWALPVAIFVGLAESILGVLVGRFPLPGVIAAGLWNLFHLPSALKARWQARRGREVGDEELFRYQVNGSARLRELYDEVGERLRNRFPEGVLSGFSDAVEAGQQRIRKPSFFVGFLAVVFALIATRGIWGDHLPIVGYALPPPDSASATLGAYAGGWNPAGLGSPEVLHPSVAAVAVVQLLMADNGGAAVALIVVASFLLGIFGTSRMLRTWGLGSVAGYFAGIVLMGGAALAGATADTHWTAIPAIAALPWVMVGSLRPWSGSLWNRAGRVADVVLPIGVVAVFVPTALLVPLIASGLWGLLGVGERWGAFRRIAIATAASLPLLLPWILYVDVAGLLTEGSSAFWEPALAVVALAGLAALGSLVSRDRVLVSLAGWGGAVALLGGIVARSGDLGSGAAVELAGQVAAAIGVAVLTGAALEAASRRKGLRDMEVAGVALGTTAAVALIAATMLVAGPGRAGLPADRLSDSFQFAASQGQASTRVLLFGSEVPGSARSLEGLSYRVFVPPYPASWEARLNDPRLGDEALQTLLEGLLDGKERRVGESLAEFGIGWVAFTEPSPLEQLFEAQLDLVPLRSLDFPVFRNEVATGLAVTPDGSAWVEAGTGYRSDDGSAPVVAIASNADHRWGPGMWQQVDWWSQVTPTSDAVRFAPYLPRRVMAITAGLWLLVLAAGWAAGRIEEERP
ncbi:MAG TPA: glycosyltransferase [Acidimicrobiia bacterium]|nr:glycosyltransferase [Acidimicrobiia bacterium]